MKLSKIAIIISLFFWPMGLWLKNNPGDFMTYLLPAVLLLLAYCLYSYCRDKQYWLIPVLLIPYLSPKLLLLPILVITILLIIGQRKIFIWLALGISLLGAVFLFKPFWGQTIFKPDYEQTQQVIRNIHLYPSILLARVYQNKVRIITDKFNHNWVSLIDPSNYFFGFHPREDYLDNQNLDKYPYLALPFLIYGVFLISKHPNKLFLMTVIVSSILALSVLTNFDRHDFILYIPLSLLTIYGINKAKINNLVWVGFLIVSIEQLIRLILIKL
jgi:hypothetical protein